jgi:hypothetical protein
MDFAPQIHQQRNRKALANPEQHMAIMRSRLMSALNLGQRLRHKPPAAGALASGFKERLAFV